MAVSKFPIFSMMASSSGFHCSTAACVQMREAESG